MTDGPAFEHLDPDECRRLLRGRDFGRVCLSVEGTTEIMLAGYVVEGDTIYFRTSAFGRLARQVETRPVTLQTDDMGPRQQASWSVTFTGPAHRVTASHTLASLWTPVRPAAWDDGVASLWIGLEPKDIRGQRAVNRPEGTLPVGVRRAGP